MRLLRRAYEKRGPIVVALICVLLAGGLSQSRIGSTDVKLMMVCRAVDLHLVDSIRWIGDAPLCGAVMSASGLAWIDASGLGLQRDFSESDGSIFVERPLGAIQEIRLSAGASVSIEAQRDSSFTMSTSGAAVSLGAILFEASLFVNSESEYSLLDTMFTLEVPEALRLGSGNSQRGTTTIAVPAGTGIAFCNGHLDTAVFYERIPGAAGAESYASSVVAGGVTFYDLMKRIEFEEGDEVTLVNLDGYLRKLAFGDNLTVIIDGTVDDIRVGLGDRARSLMPTYLEFLYANRRMTLLGSAVTLLWGLLWSIRKTIFP